MNYLCNDILIKILNYYVINHVKCKKNYLQLKKIYICKNIKNLINTYIINKLKCNILHLKTINYNVCNIHNNIDLNIIKNIVSKLDNNINNKLNNKFLSIYDHIFEYNNIKKKQNLIRYILNKYKYKLVYINNTIFRIMSVDIKHYN